MDNQKIKAVIFDCFGVLTVDKWKEFVATIPSSKRQEAADLNRALDRGMISRSEFFEQILNLTGKEVPFVEDVLVNQRDKNLQIFDYIASIKPQYKIAILSNISSNWITDSFLNQDEISLFDDLIMSHQTGLAKPDIAIYELTAERLGVDFDQCLFIDDSLSNTTVAEALGMSVITYENFVQFSQQADRLLS